MQLGKTELVQCCIAGFLVGLTKMVIAFGFTEIYVQLFDTLAMDKVIFGKHAFFHMHFASAGRISCDMASFVRGHCGLTSMWQEVEHETEHISFPR